MYCEIHLSHDYLDSQNYKDFIEDLKMIVQSKPQEGLDMSRIYKDANPTVKSTIAGAGQVDHSLVLFMTYGEWSTWHIETPLNETEKLFSTAKKIGEALLARRKSSRDLRLRLTDVAFSDENNQAVKIVGKTASWKAAWKESMEKFAIVPSLFQSAVTGLLLYLILGQQWLSSDDVPKMVVSIIALFAAFVGRVPGTVITHRNKINYTYEG